MTTLSPIKTPTLSDVAILAGVSKTAVSAVLNKRCGKTAKVGAETAKIVCAAAKKLGYKTNFIARSLATGKTGFIGFMLASSVSDGFKNPYFAGFLQGAEGECRRRGYGLAITCAPISEAGNFIHSNILSQRRIDAMIVAGELDTEVYAELKLTNIPFIVINTLPTKGIPTLDSQLQMDIFRLVSARGHRRMIMLLNSSDCNKDTIRRLAASVCPNLQLELLMPPKGLHPNWEPGFNLGKFLFEHWISVSQEKRATLIHGNGVLAEFYGEMLSAGLKCPKDVSLLGDNALDTCSFPVFTRLCADHEKIASDAVAILLAAVDSGIPVDIELCSSKTYSGIMIEGQTVKDMNKTYYRGARA